LPTSGAELHRMEPGRRKSKIGSRLWGLAHRSPRGQGEEKSDCGWVSWVVPNG